jgi:hypothetical protein
MTDRFTVRAVVVFLGAVTMLGLGGLIWLVGRTDVRDAALLGLIAGPTGTALGALGTLLARTGVDPVPVSGPAGGPVPVNDVGS